MEQIKTKDNKHKAQYLLTQSKSEKFQNFIFGLLRIKVRCTNCVHSNGFNQCYHPMFRVALTIFVDYGVCTIGYKRRRNE